MSHSVVRPKRLVLKLVLGAGGKGSLMLCWDGC